MKIKIQLKDPDGVSNSITEAARASVREINGLSEDERDELVSTREEEISEKLGRWIEYGEYLEVEFDLEAETAKVVEA